MKFTSNVNMKTRITIVAMIGLASIIAFASIDGPVASTPKAFPPITLPEAYSLAMSKLGADTNTFHCTSADSSLNTWCLSFYNTNGVLKTVVVSTNHCFLYDGHALKF